MIALLLACTAPASDSGDTHVVTGPSDCRPQADHRVVVSMPFDGAQDQWASGTLDALEGRMQLGRLFTGEVAWTPDGQVGAAALDDGSLAVWTRNGAQVVTGEWYASRVVAEPSGEALWILDGNWPENGGGLWRMPLGCDDTLGTPEFIVPSKLAVDAVFTDRGLLVLAADVGGSDEDLTLITLDGDVMQSQTVFNYEGASPSDLELGPDGSIWATDISLWGDDVNRVVVLEPGLARRFELEVRDPLDVVVGPDAAAVLSGYEDEVLLVSLDGQVLKRATAALPTSVVRHPDGFLVAENEHLTLFDLDLDVVQQVDPGFSPGTVGVH